VNSTVNDGQCNRNGENAHPKIGGWLILCALWLVLFPVQTLVSLITVLIPAVTPENWSMLTSPASQGYHSFWAPLVMVELVGNIFFFVFAVCLGVFFFQLKKYVPKLAVVFLIAYIFFVGIDFLVTQFIIFRASPIKMDTITNLVRSVAAGLIWIPYFIFSKRVQRTFVN
jgi:hypothetical protein